MNIRYALMAFALVTIPGGVVGSAVAEDSLDALTPMDSSGLGDVKGAVASDDEADPALRGTSAASAPAASSFEGANTLSANEANSVGLGVISLNNNVEHSALSLSNSLVSSGAGTGIGTP
jgi:hypothetical protein